MKNQIKWAIVVTTNAPSIVVKSFIAHHLYLGANEIFIYFDNAQHDKDFDQIERIFCIDCDSHYYQRNLNLERPDNHRLRQILNANHAKKLCTSDWICHIDIDEFLYPVSSIDKVLVSLPTDVEMVRISPAENVYRKAPNTWRDTFDATFRVKFSNDKDGYVALQNLYGDIGTFFPHGLQSHIEGKIFMKKRCRLNLSIHDGMYISSESLILGSYKNVEVQKRPLPFQTNSLKLLHFFSLGYADWCNKYLRRLEINRYTATKIKKRKKWDLLRAAACNGEAGVRDLYETMNLISPSQEKVLSYMNALLEPDLKIPDKVSKFFGSNDHGFDEQLPVLNFSDLEKSLYHFKNSILSSS